MTRHGIIRLFSLIVLLTLLLPCVQSLRACPVCYGETDAHTAEGITLAVLMMVGVTGGVVAGIIAFFVNIKRRASRAVGEIVRIHELN